QMRRMRDRQPQKYRFMKMPPASISSIDEVDDTVLIPRGFKKNLINLASSYDREITFHDDTLLFPREPDTILNESLILKDYQRAGLSALTLNREGVVVAPCGGGKTVLGIATICTLAQPTLVLVHTTDLMHQWQGELASKAIIPKGVGQWGGGVKKRGRVVVGMVQTLIRMPVSELCSFLGQFGCVILDECHHCPADTFLAIVNMCQASYRIGLTATPKRKDGLEFLMTDTIGPILTEITDDDLEAEGRSQSCEVNDIHTTFFTRYTADEWTNLITEMVNDGDRNRLIVTNVLKSWNDGLFPLVLSDRVAHCHQLAESLRSSGMNAQLMTGSTPKELRRQVVQHARDGLVDCIVATKVADEGLDIDTLSAIHLTAPTANEPKIKQRIGRIRRPLPGKRSVVYDYIDERVASCARMARVRKRLYRKWGFKLNS
ncbi:MAG: hypothetical protein CMB80_01270, partial [Flammeovirgaceae bacterium]|nr:hypothetical protein [Flammeovirgaceae bacterium]